jgi:hypothetical protein
LLMLGSCGLVAAPDPALFRDRIAPLLTAQCLDCHGGRWTRSGFDVSTREALLRGGDEGVAVVPGNAKGSRFIQFLTHELSPGMPYKKDKLSAEEIALFARWIDAGAPFDGTLQPGTTEKTLTVTEADRQFWSFRKLQPVEPPAVKHPARVKTPVDNFILAAQEKRGLQPSPPADNRVLLRRLTFDLIGLPPAPAELDAFAANGTPESYSQEVTRLLASEHHGERWGRHWLDVARYADSNGYERDEDRPSAWHYRDFVINALNRDLPFHQFLRWQLAGDEYAPGNLDALAATGFCAAGPSDTFQKKEMNPRTRYDELDDMLSTTTLAVLGLNMNCARCHDHKNDPIPQRDYYRMLSVFLNAVPDEVFFPPPATQPEGHLADAAFKKAEAAVADWLSAKNTAHGTKYREDLEKKLSVSEWAELKALEKKRAASFTERQQYMRRLITESPDEPSVAHLLIRGEPRQPGEAMKPGFLAVLTTGAPDLERWQTARPADTKSSLRRRALAEWLTDLDNGAGNLTARVIVNRLWQHHFGVGLVATPNDFGLQGARPTHPELLEYLAGQLIAHGWRLKPLHRLIVESATYQQASAPVAASAALDPDNTLLWRQNSRRLEGEIIRDTMLAVAGTLNPKLFGPPVFPAMPRDAIATGSNVKWPLDAVDGPDTWRRSIYIFIRRSLTLPMVAAYDGPDAAASCGRRQETIVPAQALELLNGPFALEQARHFADRVRQDAGPDPAAQVRRAMALAWGRDPSPAEIDRATRFLTGQVRLLASEPPSKQRHEALVDFCRVLFNSNELIYLD